MDRKPFIDTMVFLHFRPLDELDLPSRVHSDTVTLVIPRITLRELDKHKSVHPNRKVRDRARKILTDLETAIANRQPLKGGIAVEYFATHPTEHLQNMQLNPEWADDILVASVVAYRDETANADITVVTQDTGPRLTCLHHRLTTLQLDDSVALPEELDDTERENRSLQLQIQRMQNAMPRLEAVFAGSKNPRNVARFTISPQSKIDEQKLSDALKDLREAYPKMETPVVFPQGHPLAGSLTSTVKMMARFDPNAISKDQIEDYNDELDEFYLEAESYLRELHCFREPKSRTISFTLEVCNTGTAPADDVDVLFHFPDGFLLLSEDDLPDEPEPPMPPEVPLSRADQLNQAVNHTRSMLDRMQLPPHFRPSSSFRITKTQSYNVTDHFAKIKHGIPASLPKMYILFPSVTEAKSFNCTFELRPANLTAPVTGELHFVIESK